jgi:ubiquinone/menaquinone biosynthesis C-methylase UbiE
MSRPITDAHAQHEETRIRDAYARRQTLARDSWFDAAHLFMIQQRERRVLPLLARQGFGRLEETRILEIGCGTGQWLRDFVKWGARPDHITGVDLLADRIAIARRLCSPDTVLKCGSAAALDVPDASFDLVLQSTVFTSILDAAMRRSVAAEMLRVLRPDGMILWYDYHVDNPANPDVRGVRKREIHELFPRCRIQLQRETLAPPLARAVAPYSLLACHLLDAVPLLRTHYLGAIRKPMA